MRCHARGLGLPCWIASAEETSAFFSLTPRARRAARPLCTDFSTRPQPRSPLRTPLSRDRGHAIGSSARASPGIFTSTLRPNTSRTLSYTLTQRAPHQPLHTLSHTPQHLLHTAPGMHTGTTHHHLPLKFLLTAFKSVSVISSRPFFVACSSACLHRASSMGSSASSSATTAP